MYKNHTIAVIIPVFNEESRIEGVVNTLPDFVDQVVVVDDASTDNTKEVVRRMQEENPELRLLQNPEQGGCGAAMARGYKWVRDQGYDIAVRMDGDGQMAPSDLPKLLNPIVNGESDCAKGNRFFTGEAYQRMPKIRYFGNSILSFLTKIASGYWQLADSQSGYVAVNKKVLDTLEWDEMYEGYGQPNDLLVMLNVYDFCVADIPIKPVYGIGEESRMKEYKVVFPISWNLLRRFLWRLKEKYVIRNFHPLVFFYLFGVIFGIASLILFGRVFYIWLGLGGLIPRINALAAMFSFLSSAQFMLFAMWFDMEENKVNNIFIYENKPEEISAGPGIQDDNYSQDLSGAKIQTKDTT